MSDTQQEAPNVNGADRDYPTLWSEWGLHRAANGTPLLNLSNAVAILEHDRELQGIAHYDEFLQRIIHREGREWNDADDISLALYMQRQTGINRMGRDIVSQALIAASYKHRTNCVRGWLDSLSHDGTARVNDFFADCFGAEASDYTTAASRNFWISMVARVYQPGCKVDNMVVLEGAQGAGKSSALQLIGAQWFAEQHESATNPKAFSEVLQGKLLIEISEMDAFNRVEVSRVKQTISCPSDRFRASYGRHAQDHPRQCVFVGTTNRDDWNRDETGARRFWPIACTNIRLDLISANREQLFAEAVARYKAGEPHWMMPAEPTTAEQDARYQADPWMHDVAKIIKGESNVTTAFVFDKLDIPLKSRDRASEMRIGACLRALRWKRKRARVPTTSAGADNRAYVFVPPYESS